MPPDDGHSASEAETVAILEALAAGWAPGQPQKTATGTIARRLGWRASRVHELWYRRARRIEAHELDRLRAALVDVITRYEVERERFMAAHPSLARLAPPAASAAGALTDRRLSPVARGYLAWALERVARGLVVVVALATLLAGPDMPVRTARPAPGRPPVVRIQREA
jgi:hypothetical protein